MRRLRLRAFVLTAGRGRRLEPLSLFVPKPLLPVCGEPIVGHTLRQLAALGCEAALLNLHHLPDEISSALGRSYYGLPLLYSWEKEIQGTLGALHPRRDFLAAADLVLLVNGDTLCRWPWKKLLRRHLRSAADATLLLLRRPPEEALGGGVGVDARGAVVQLRDGEAAGKVARRRVFAGAHILSPRLLERVEAGPADIIDALYQPLLAGGGRIESVTTSRRWHDAGTAERYLAADVDWVRGPWPWPWRRRDWISPLAVVSDDAYLHRSVVEAGAEVGSDVKMDSSAVLPGARVASGSRILSSIIGPGVRLASAANIERRMINRVKIDYRPRADESVIGDHVYTPI